ncbi:G protein-coupled receptor gpr1 [Rhizina undulata]
MDFIKRADDGTDVWLDDPIYGLSRIPDRVISSQYVQPIYTDQQLYILRVIALVGATFSLLTGLVVGWWFVRMKRSFRHHLIMLLIFSDFFKASWQLTYPAVVFTKGAVASMSKFCQASGFFMSMGVEASDFAVLVIAVHSALYIFRPGLTATGEGGLFRYRYYLYAAWLAFSIIMPALAFVNHNPPYTAQETFCYLPVRPYWYRISLAWIPRYIILLLIFILYASIYTYVRMKFRTFRTSVGGSTLEMDTVDLQIENKPSETPRMPSLDAHGLIPPTPTLDAHQFTTSNGQPFAKALLAPSACNEKMDFSTTPTDPESRSAKNECSGSPSRRGSIPWQNGGQNSNTFLAGNRNQDTASAELRRRRIAISRQLRLLFIYPLVYALMWVPSLVSTSLQYKDYFVTHPNFPLACLVSFTVPVQCAVDCWLFTIREKPWRHIPQSNGKSIWSRYGFGFGGSRSNNGDSSDDDGEGWRNRKGMTFEARKAYERRESERKEAAEQWLARQDGRGKVKDSSESQSRNKAWWDPLGNGNDNELEEAENDEIEETQRHEDELSTAEKGRALGATTPTSTEH